MSFKVELKLKGQKARITRKLKAAFHLVSIVTAFTIIVLSSKGSASDLKWDQEGIPHKGWTHLGVVELEEAKGVCQMCSQTNIRYMHTVTHEDYGDLDVGCTCAEKMCEDYETPKQVERAKKAAAQKLRKQALRAERLAQEAQAAQEREALHRQRLQIQFQGIQNWNLSQKGGYYWKLNSDVITIFQSYNQWKYVYQGTFSKGGYPTAQDALNALYPLYKHLVK